MTDYKSWGHPEEWRALRLEAHHRLRYWGYGDDDYRLLKKLCRKDHCETLAPNFDEMSADVCRALLGEHGLIIFKAICAKYGIEP